MPRSRVADGDHCAPATSGAASRANKAVSVVRVPRIAGSPEAKRRPRKDRGRLCRLACDYCLRALEVRPSPIDLIAVLLAFESMLNIWLSAWNSVSAVLNSMPLSSAALILSTRPFIVSAFSPSIWPSAWAIATSQLLEPELEASLVPTKPWIDSLPMVRLMLASDISVLLGYRCRLVQPDGSGMGLLLDWWR